MSDENNTIFGKILRKEIPAKFLHEDEYCVAFADVSPQAPVHVLIIPRHHIAKLSDAKPADAAVLGHLMLAAGEVARKLGVADAFRLVINNGAGAGQSVFHLHMHLLAGRPLDWPPG